MAESIASLRRVSMTGSITWNSKKQGVYDLLKKNQMEALSFHSRISSIRH